MGGSDPFPFTDMINYKGIKFLIINLLYIKDQVSLLLPKYSVACIWIIHATCMSYKVFNMKSFHNNGDIWYINFPTSIL